MTKNVRCCFSFFFEITVNTHNDDPILTKILPLEISEGGTGVIGNMLIAASDEESPPAEIKFTLDPNSELEEPNYGEVKLNGVVLSDGEGFTMADVNSNLVTYTHDGSQNFNDFFLFNVSDPQGGVAHDGEYTLFHFNVVINNENDAPILAKPLQDMQTRAEEAFSFVVPEETFEDVDPGDILSYTSMLVGDANLPGWLGFDQGTVKFSGTPQLSDIGTLEIILIASDMSLAEARDTFQLMVIQPVSSGPEEAEPILKIGPNPFTETVFISFNENITPPAEIVVHNVLGEKTVIRCRNNQPVIELDLKDYPPGIYYLQVKIGDDIIVSKL